MQEKAYGAASLSGNVGQFNTIEIGDTYPSVVDNKNFCPSRETTKLLRRLLFPSTLALNSTRRAEESVPEGKDETEGGEGKEAGDPKNLT